MLFSHLPGPGALTWGVLFFIFTTIIVFNHVLKGSKVTTDMLYGAVTVYLLIGLTFTSIYALLETIHAGSFVISDSPGDIYPFKLHELVYFSYTTLTTLGYGEIIPISAQARTFAICEAI